MEISRRLFLGGMVTTPAAAVPLLQTFLHDLDLEVDRGLELRDDDFLVVRIPEWMNEADIESAGRHLREHVWPNVVIVSAGVEFDVIRRALGRPPGPGSGSRSAGRGSG